MSQHRHQPTADDAHPRPTESDPFVYPLAENPHNPDESLSRRQDTHTTPRTPVRASHISPFSDQSATPSHSTLTPTAPSPETVARQAVSQQITGRNIHGGVTNRHRLTGTGQTQSSTALVEKPDLRDESSQSQHRQAGVATGKPARTREQRYPLSPPSDPDSTHTAQSRSARWPDVGPTLSRRTAFLSTLTAILALGNTPDPATATIGESGSLSVTAVNGATGGNAFTPSDVKINGTETTFEVDWDGVTPGNKLFLDLSVKAYDPTETGYEKIATGGFTVETVSGNRTLTADELFDSTKLFLTNHSSIDASDFQVYSDPSLPNPAVGSDDKFVVNSYAIEATVRTSTQTLTTKRNDFDVEYAVFGGFGTHFGYNFGKEEIKNFPHVSNVPDSASTTVVEGATVDMTVQSAFGGRDGPRAVPELFKLDPDITEFIISWQDLRPGELLFVEVSMKPMAPDDATFELIGGGGFSVAETSGAEALDADYLFDDSETDMTTHSNVSLEDFRVFSEAELANPNELLRKMEPTDKTVVNTYEIRTELRTATQTIGSQIAKFDIEFAALAGDNLELFGYNFDNEEPGVYPSV